MSSLYIQACRMQHIIYTKRITLSGLKSNYINQLCAKGRHMSTRLKMKGGTLLPAQMHGSSAESWESQCCHQQKMHKKGTTRKILPGLKGIQNAITELHTQQATSLSLQVMARSKLSRTNVILHR